MTDDWKTEFNRAIADALVELGTPVDNMPGGSLYYGYIAGDWQEVREHMRACSVNYETAVWEDAEWTEFAGTFAERDNDKNGIEITASCKCGKITGRKWRYSESYAELINRITKQGDH